MKTQTPKPAPTPLERLPFWWLTKDGDRECLEMYERHYSAHKYKDGRKRRLFVGPGEKIVLRTLLAEAIFVWKKFKSDDAQTGVCCAVFRNESYPVRSSLLIEQADAIADFCWPGERHYTYINPEAVQSRNPGYCFLCAGWCKCGTTARGLLILERKAFQ